jgi:ASC-1-like (ASCH) protein
MIRFTKSLLMHELKVKEKYYNMLKSEIKTIELRLFDEKRRTIKVGDFIRFSNSSDADDTFTAQVINLYKADNFVELCKSINCHKAGFTTNEELIKVLEVFYGLDKQKEYGVVGIEIQKIQKNQKSNFS